MATHKVKAGNVAQMWDKPESPRTNQGSLTASTPVTVSAERKLDVLYYQLSSHHGWWSKASWFEALPVVEPPPPAVEEYILHVRDGVTRKFIPA